MKKRFLPFSVAEFRSDYLCVKVTDRCCFILYMSMWPMKGQTIKKREKHALHLHCGRSTVYLVLKQTGQKNFTVPPTERRRASRMATALVCAIPDCQCLLSQLSSFLAESVQEKSSDISLHFLRPRTFHQRLKRNSNLMQRYRYQNWSTTKT